jgi:hypothetical protein
MRRIELQLGVAPSHYEPGDRKPAQAPAETPGGEPEQPRLPGEAVRL